MSGITNVIIDLNSLGHLSYHSFSPMHWNSTIPDLFDENSDLKRQEAIYVDLSEKIWIRMNRYFKMFSADHMILAGDGRSSWRYEIFPEYKSGRKLSRSQQKEEDMETIHLVMNDIAEYARSNTKMTVLADMENIEADDIIARWCQLHDIDNRFTVIVSSDGDFKQLVSERVALFTPTNYKLYHNGRIYAFSEEPSTNTEILFGNYWETIIDNDTDTPLEFDPGYLLFEKIIRGDRSDSIPSAYPRVRKKKIAKAFYGTDAEFNSFINETYAGPNGEIMEVYPTYIRNAKLIDLTLLPENIVNRIDEAIIKEANRRHCNNPTLLFSQYVAKMGFNNLMKSAYTFSSMLESPYI